MSNSTTDVMFASKYFKLS